MTDIRTRLAHVDRLEPPDDLWEASTSRLPTFDRSPAPRVQTGWRKAGVIAVAFAVFGAAVLFAWSVLDVEPEPPTPPPAPGSDPFASLPAGWTELPEPPEVRCCSAEAWTGSELLIWGGHVGQTDESLDTGWRYDAEVGEWRPMPASPLGARSQAAGVWTGSELLVWGGADYRTDYPYDGYDDGAAFDPATDRWRMLPPSPLDGRQPLAVWTGEEMIVWGSTDREQRRVDGAAYDPEADTWRRIADAPIELTDATASWTGEEMIVFGAALHGGNRPESRTAIGAAYDPSTDTWRQIADSELDTNANTSVWSDGRLLAFDYNLDAAAYDPAEDRWVATGRVPTDECEDIPTSVVAGTAFGRLCGGLLRFDPERNEWRSIDAPAKDFFPDEMFGAGSTLLVEGVVGRFGDRDDVRLFAYRDTGGGTPSSPQPVETPRVTARIPFPAEDAHGGGVAFGSQSVWVGMASGDRNADGSVLRIDPLTNRIVAEISTSGPTFRSRIAATSDAVWVGSTTEGVVERIDPSTNTVSARVTVEGTVSAVAADESAVWVVAVDDRADAGEQNVSRLVRIDPGSNEVVAEVPLGTAATGYEDGVVLAGGSVWVLGSRLVDEDHEDGGDLVRIDPTTNEVTVSIPVDGFRMVVHEDEETIWVRSPRDGLFDESRGEVWVWRTVDLATNEVSEPFRFPSDLDGGLEAITGDRVWAVSYDENDWPIVVGFDPSSLEEVTRSDPVRALYTDAQFDPVTGAAWLTTLDAIVRIDTHERL